jgi:cell wall-associated NlpC family hydrolase
VALPRAVAVAGIATATTVAFSPSAAADPSPSVAEVARQVTDLDGQASLEVERYLQAQQKVDDVQRRADAAAQRAAAEQARLDAVKGQMSGVVAAAYRNGADSSLVALVSNGGPQSYLDRVSALDRLAQSQADVLAQIATERSRATADKAAADRELRALREAHQQLADRKDQVERTLRAQQALLANLQEQDRQRVEAARAAAEAAAVPAPAARASRGGARTAAPAAAAPAAVAPAAMYTGPATGRAQIAVQEAYRQLGKPYQYGGSGPDSFDCSGLTSWVWRAAGVALPRTAQSQYDSGRKVAQSDVQPGDLVYFGGSTGSIGHVGVYIGNGNMISAPHTGDVVKIQPAFRSDFVGATRP